MNLRDAVAKDGTSPASFFVHGTASTTLLGHVEGFDVTSFTDFQRNLAAERSGLSDEALASASWHRVVPERVYYADPIRGSESWVAASDFTAATANPLAGANAELIRRLAAKQRNSRVPRAAPRTRRHLRLPRARLGLLVARTSQGKWPAHPWRPASALGARKCRL